MEGQRRSWKVIGGRSRKKVRKKVIKEGHWKVIEGWSLKDGRWRMVIGRSFKDGRGRH